MEQSVNTKIIEFNGLAGCGKTTLAQALKDGLRKNSCRAVLFSDAYQIFREHPIKNIISCLNLILFFQYIRLFFIAGRNKNYKLYFYVRYMYWAALKISLVYHWCLKRQEFDYVLCDHGLIQNIITILGFEEIKNWDKINKSLASIFKAEGEINVVNCNISIGQSMQRIRKRNRNTGPGRLDLIRGDLELRKLLKITKGNFSKVRNIANTVRKDWPITNLEMNVPVETNVKRMLSLLIQGMNKNEH